MKKLSILLYAIIITLLIANIYEIYQIIKYRNSIKYIINDINLYRDREKRQTDNLIIQLKCENTRLMINQTLMDENDVERDLADIIKNNSPTLVVRLSEFNCKTCVNSLIQIIKETFSELDLKKVIFLLDYKDSISVNFFKRVSGIKYTYKANDKITCLDELNVPYLFCLTKDGIINKVFIPQEGVNEKLTKSYLEYIAQHINGQK
jgi:hypothetical protein